MGVSHATGHTVSANSNHPEDTSRPHAQSNLHDHAVSDARGVLIDGQGNTVNSADPMMIVYTPTNRASPVRSGFLRQGSAATTTQAGDRSPRRDGGQGVLQLPSQFKRPPDEASPAVKLDHAHVFQRGLEHSQVVAAFTLFATRTTVVHGPETHKAVGRMSCVARSAQPVTRRTHDVVR